MTENSNGHKIAVSIITGISIIYLGWLSTTVVGIKAKVDSPAVPETTEKSLVEIRQRINNDQQERLALHELATNNVRDISYIKESLVRLEKKIDDLPDGTKHK